MNNDNNNNGTLIKELCEKYNFKSKFSGINDNFYCEVYAKNTDGYDALWFAIQLANHDSNNGLPFVPIITIYGNTDQNNIWLCDTRKDLSVYDVLDFCKEISNICNCKLTAEYSNKKDEIYIHHLVDIEDLQELGGYKSLEDVKRYINLDCSINNDNKLLDDIEKEME